MIRIITDSAADFSREELEQNRIHSVPLQIAFGDDTCADNNEDLPAGAFWSRLNAGENPKTSQPSPEAFLRLFEEARAAGDEVICILLSSALSGTFQSALLARGMLDDAPVYLVDSLLATIGEKLLVLHTCRLRDEGLSAGDIARELERFKTRIRVLGCLNTLDNLARGGRIPKAAANLGTLVQLKPLVTLTPDGHISLAGKGMGLHRATDALIRLVLERPADPAYPALPLYTHTTENCAAFVRKLNQAGFACDMEDAMPVGPTIGTHLGPSAFGIAYVTAD